MHAVHFDPAVELAALSRNLHATKNGIDIPDSGFGSESIGVKELFDIIGSEVVVE